MIEAGRDDVVGGIAGDRGRARRWLVALVLLLVVSLGVGWGVARVRRGEAYQIRMLRQGLSAAAAPDELVVVDSKVLGWVLRRGGWDRNLTGLEVMSDRTAPSSLLADLEEHRREIVVLAQPGSRLVRTLSAAGYVLVERQGEAAWDVPGRAARLTGWGQYRIFFVRLPKVPLTDGGGHDGAVESGMHGGMQHEMK